MNPLHEPAGRVDPTDAASPMEFVEKLREVRRRAGNPSLAEIERRSRRMLARSTTSDLLNKNRLPRMEQLRAFLSACAVPESDHAIWLETWVRLSSHTVDIQGDDPRGSHLSPITNGGLARVEAEGGAAEWMQFREDVKELIAESKRLHVVVSSLQRQLDTKRAASLKNNGSEGQVLHDRYRLVYKLGSGGMGSVWLAEDQLLERSVALKMLIPYIGVSSQEQRTRALLEARAMARVRHAAIVPIHDVVFSEDDPWIVMEFISGRSLYDISHNHPIDERTIAKIMLPVARGLSAVHRAGVIHRDIKPSNILVTDDDSSVYLVDFGIAKIAGHEPLTGQRTVLGTLEFLAPERISGDRAGPASDLWSLGATIFHAMEGHPPFARHEDRSMEATLMAILVDDPPALTKKGKLAEVVLQLLRKDPALRPDEADVAIVLQEILDRP